MKQTLVAWVAAYKLFFTISLLYAIGSGLAVLVGAHQPVDWHPIFGSFNNAWSVRKMWGSCWHQLMRWPCAEAGKIVKSLCRFRTGSFASRYSQIWIGFAVSAMIHHAGAVVSMLEDNGRWQAVYFCIQPIGIMIEDGVMGIARRYGIQMTGRLPKLSMDLKPTFKHGQIFSGMPGC